MGFTAFEIFPLIENIPRQVTIESIASWGDKLFIGTTDGSLLVYTVNYNPIQDSNNKPFTYHFHADISNKSFSRKAVTQLCAIPELSILVSLSDGLIRLHMLSNLRELGTLLNSKDQPVKGLTFFAIKKQNQQYTLIAGSKKKSFVLFRYNSKMMTFVFQEELVLPDVARSAIWSGDTICVGFKREYAMIDPKGVAPKTLFQLPSTQSATLDFGLPDEIVVVRDNVALTLDFDGKPTLSHSIVWGDTPTCIGYLSPYLIAPVGMMVEVRILTKPARKDNFVQTFPNISNIVHMSQPNFIDLDEGKIDEGLGVGYKARDEINKDDDIVPDFRIFLATKKDVYIMCMKQFSRQVQELQAKAEFDLALHLCELCANTRFEVPKWTVDSVHLDYGFNLFSRGEYEAAVKHFSQTESDPRIVLALFPDLLPSGKSNHINVPIPPEEKNQIDNLLTDIEQRNSALTSLIPYLNDRRIPADQTVTEREVEMIGEAVDTALLKCILYTNKDYAISFLEKPNRCHIGDCEKVLHHYKKFSELVLFYKTKGQHQRALLLLKRLGVEQKSDAIVYHDLEGVRPTIKYLQELKGHDDLILEYSKWVLREAPILGLKIFTHKDSPFDVYHVLKHLDNIEGGKSLSMKIGFLEYLINLEKSRDPELHNSLCLYYLKYVTASDGSRNEVWPREEVNERLRQFLSGSQHYNPSQMLSKFPFDALYEERAILLSRINRHSQALAIYVHKLKRQDLAEQYCAQHYDPNKQESKEIFITLLEMFLQPPDGGEIQLDAAVHVLESHYDKIDIVRALSFIPSHISVFETSKYLENVLRKHTETRRRTQVMKNLARSENLQVQEKYINERKRHVKVKYGRMCPVCKKRIGLSAFALFPSGHCVHAACSTSFEKQYQQKTIRK